MKRKLITKLCMIIGNATVLGVGVAGVIYSTYEKKAPTPIEPIIPMPSDLLNIDENNYVRGFVEGFDKDDPKWKAYNAIEIPKNAEGYLSVFAFTSANTPESIKKLVLNTDDNDVLKMNIQYLINQQPTPIKEIILPQNVKTVYDYALDGCAAEKIDFSKCEVLENMGTGAFRLAKIKEITFPATIKSATAVCYECEDLTTVTFLKNTNDSVLYQDYSVQRYGCFKDCTNLSTIIFEGLDEVPNNYTWGSLTFSNIAQKGTIISRNGKLSSKDLLAYFQNNGQGRGGFDFAEWTAGK